MKKFLAVALAVLSLAITVQPAKAADVKLTVKFLGSQESFLGANVSLTAPNESFVQPLSAEGTATFSVPAANYKFSFSSGSAAALAGLSVSQQQVTAPGSIELTMPTARYTSVRYVLPDGSLLPGIWQPTNMPYARVSTGDGFSWSTRIAQPVSVVDGITKYKVFVAADSRGQYADPNYDQDFDGYNDLAVNQSTANGGYRNLLIPSSLLIKGGDFAVSDASYLQFDQREISGAVRSNFTITGRIVNVGKGVSATMMRYYFLNSQALFISNGFYNGPGTSFVGQKAPNADGTFILNIVLNSTMPFFTASQTNALYSFPSANLPVKTTTAKLTYKSCAALNADFQGGVTSYTFKNKGVAPKFKSTFNDKLFKAVKKLDVDNDGIACEK